MAFGRTTAFVAITPACAQNIARNKLVIIIARKSCELCIVNALIFSHARVWATSTADY